MSPIFNRGEQSQRQDQKDHRIPNPPEQTPPVGNEPWDEASRQAAKAEREAMLKRIPIEKRKTAALMDKIRAFIASLMRRN